MVAGAGTLTSVPPLAVAGTGGCSTVAASATANTTMPVTAAAPMSPQGTSNTSNTNSQGSDVGPTRPRSGENRRSNKPIMEKRRRARINNCLNELKTLILDAMKKDPARHSKLEKADILEMTVKHLESLQRQQVAMAAATDPSITNKFRAGFTECAGEVGRFPGLDGPVKRRLLQHLSNCLNNAVPTQTSQTSQNPPASPAQSSSETQSTTPLQVHILRTPESNIIQGLQLVPTRLPNGDLALILPAARAAAAPSPSSPSPSVTSSSSSSSPLPMLIPIPGRTTANSPSPVSFDRLSVTSPQQQVKILTSQPRPPPSQHPMQYQAPMLEEVEGRLVISEDFDHNQGHYESDRETMLHIPEREYYDESYEESESDYYSPHQGYSPEEMPKPLALVTRKRFEDTEEDQPWRPW